MTDWTDHLEKFKKKNPSVSHLEALKQAKETYKPKSKSKSQKPKSKTESLHIPTGARPRGIQKGNRLYRKVMMQETQLEIQGKLPKDMRGGKILKTVDPVRRTIALDAKQTERKMNELTELVGETAAKEAQGMSPNELRAVIYRVKNPIEETV